MRKLAVLLIGLLILSGCATTHNLSNIRVDKNPLIKIEKDPDAKITDYKTFSVMPLAGTAYGKETSRITEKQMLFSIRNVLEAFGYTFVNDHKDADFIVALNFNQEYKTTYIPPNAMTIPWFVPGWTSYSNFSVSGNNAFAGHVNYNGTMSTQYPSYWTTQTLITPGQTFGFFYPVLAIHIFDKKTGLNVWEGGGVTRSEQADIRLAARAFIFQILQSFPEKTANTKTAVEWYRWGITVLIDTNNGNDYYPSVVKLSRKWSADLIHLRPFDFITAINGESTLNKSFAEFREMVRNLKDGPATLTIQRPNKTFDIDIYTMPLAQ